MTIRSRLWHPGKEAWGTASRMRNAVLLATATGPITAGDDSAKCVDDNGQSTANGTKIQLWDCNGGASQQWHLP